MMKYTTALVCVVILGIATLNTFDTHEENPPHEAQMEETLALRPPLDPRSLC